MAWLLFYMGGDEAPQPRRPRAPLPADPAPARTAAPRPPPEEREPRSEEEPDPPPPPPAAARPATLRPPPPRAEPERRAPASIPASPEAAARFAGTPDPASSGEEEAEVFLQFRRRFNSTCRGEWLAEFEARQRGAAEAKGSVVFNGVHGGGLSDMLRGFGTAFWVAVVLEKRFFPAAVLPFFKGAVRQRAETAATAPQPIALGRLNWVDTPRFRKEWLRSLPRDLSLATNVPDASAVVGLPSCVDCWTLEQGREAPQPLPRYRGADAMHLRGCAFHSVLEPTPDFVAAHSAYRQRLLGWPGVGGGRVTIALHARLQTPSDAAGFGGGAAHSTKAWTQWAVSWYGRKTNCKKLVDDMLACGALLERAARSRGATDVVQVWLSDNPQTQRYIAQQAPNVKLPPTGAFCHSSAGRAKHCSARDLQNTLHEFFVIAAADYVVHSTGHFSTTASQLGFLPHQNLYNTWEGRPISGQIVQAGAPQLCQPLSVRMQFP
eukprot:TRINITY_DN42062_c0_g1_i1.p1 TRINITY_DN42062_c0_g1~~TRINITY_DN42062_c0_g1_i1.p1  ORF type:complete len:527 (+),score=147.01 TRINITY_DN42062_c0_g1_i1:108-1583(+)